MIGICVWEHGMYWSAVSGIRGGIFFATALFFSFSKMRPNLKKGRGRDAFFHVSWGWQGANSPSASFL